MALGPTLDRLNSRASSCRTSRQLQQGIGHRSCQCLTGVDVRCMSTQSLCWAPIVMVWFRLLREIAWRKRHSDECPQSQPWFDYTKWCDTISGARDNWGMAQRSIAGYPRWLFLNAKLVNLCYYRQVISFHLELRNRLRNGNDNLKNVRKTRARIVLSQCCDLAMQETKEV